MSQEYIMDVNDTGLSVSITLFNQETYTGCSSDERDFNSLNKAIAFITGLD